MIAVLKRLQITIVSDCLLTEKKYVWSTMDNFLVVVVVDVLVFLLNLSVICFEKIKLNNT